MTPAPGAVLEPTRATGEGGQADLACVIRLALEALSKGDAAAVEQLRSPRSEDSIHQVLQEAFEAEGQRLAEGQQGGYRSRDRRPCRGHKAAREALRGPNGEAARETTGSQAHSGCPSQG